MALDEGEKAEVALKAIISPDKLVEQEGSKTKEEAVSESSDALALDEGDKVEANYKNIGKWYPGKIHRVRGNGVFDIGYDDGEMEMHVNASNIRYVKSRSMKTAARAVSFSKSLEQQVGITKDEVMPDSNISGDRSVEQEGSKTKEEAVSE